MGSTHQAPIAAQLPHVATHLWRATLRFRLHLPLFILRVHFLDDALSRQVPVMDTSEQGVSPLSQRVCPPRHSVEEPVDFLQ